MELHLQVPRINDYESGYTTLFALWQKLSSSTSEQIIILDLSQCAFLPQNGVAFLLGLARLAQQQGRQIRVIEPESEDVTRNLRKNGFMAALGLPHERLSSTAVPVREDKHRDEASYIEYLNNYWLTGSRMNLSNQLKDVIISAVIEAYVNVFDHAQSPNGAFTCGQFYPNREEIILTLVDFGIGIPATVRRRLECPDLSAKEAIEWVFQEGRTTQSGPRGNGLKILKEFVKLNKGSLDVYSEDCHACINAQGESFSRQAAKFTGTVVQIMLKSNDMYYHLSSEDESSSDELFF